MNIIIVERLYCITKIYSRSIFFYKFLQQFDIEQFKIITIVFVNERFYFVSEFLAYPVK